MSVPEYVLTHLAALFAGGMSMLGIGWFTSLSMRVSRLELENAQHTETIKRLRKRLYEAGIEDSEVFDA